MSSRELEEWQVSLNTLLDRLIRKSSLAQKVKCCTSLDLISGEVAEVLSDLVATLDRASNSARKPTAAEIRSIHSHLPDILKLHTVVSVSAGVASLKDTPPDLRAILDIVECHLGELTQ